MGLFSSSSKSQSNTENHNEQMQVGARENGVAIGANATATISNVGLDPAIARINAELQSAVGAQSTDAVKAVAGLGADVLNRMGGVFTDVTTRAGANSATAWEHTLDVAGDVLIKQMETGKVQSDSARALATQAISAANPQQDANSTVFKVVAAIAAALVAAAVIFKKG